MDRELAKLKAGDASPTECRAMVTTDRSARRSTLDDDRATVLPSRRRIGGQSGGARRVRQD